MKQLPQFLQKYFWDVDFSKLDQKLYPRFIIERILEYGDREAVKWMQENFDLNMIKTVLANSKNLSQRSANFWQLVFNVKKDKILCLKKSFQEKRRLIWKH